MVDSGGGSRWLLYHFSQLVFFILFMSNAFVWIEFLALLSVCIFQTPPLAVTELIVEKGVVGVIDGD